MNINFDTRKEPDDTYTVVITFSDIPNEDQAIAAGNLVKRALMQHGAIGSTLPLSPKRK